MHVQDCNMLTERDMQIDVAGFSHHHQLPMEGIKDMPVTASDASRRWIDNFLSSHTVYEILPDSGKVIVLDLALPITQAFHVMHEQGIPLAPLWDSDRQQFAGILTASDFVSILRQIGSQRPVLSEEEFEAHTIAAWKDEKTRLLDYGRRRVPLQYAGPDDLLKDVAKKLLHHQVATLPVLHFSTGEDTDMPQILHLATLSGILSCLCRHIQHGLGALPLLSQPIGALALGTWRTERQDCDLTILRASSLLSTALKLIEQARVSSIPIVDDYGSLLDVYSKSDITALAKDSVYARVQLDQITIDQALQLVHDGISSRGAASVSRCQMCLRTDTLQYIMERLAIPGVRRVVCVEAGSRRVEGIITLSDVFKFLLF